MQPKDSLKVLYLDIPQGECYFQNLTDWVTSFPKPVLQTIGIAYSVLSDGKCGMKIKAMTQTKFGCGPPHLTKLIIDTKTRFHYMGGASDLLALVIINKSGHLSDERQIHGSNAIKFMQFLISLVQLGNTSESSWVVVRYYHRQKELVDQVPFEEKIVLRVPVPTGTRHM